MSAFHDSNLARATPFLRQYYAHVLFISALVLIPCFWLPHAGWGDFPSHVYNAWLAPQIERGELPGLTLAHLHTNVLTDLALQWLMVHAGVNAAQRIVLAASVLLMFWGMFAMVAAISRRAPWWLAPIFAMLCYGWAFHLGFLNNYFSTAVCFFVFALLWSQATLVDGFIALLLSMFSGVRPPGSAHLVDRSAGFRIDRSPTKTSRPVVVARSLRRGADRIQSFHRSETYRRVDSDSIAQREWSRPVYIFRARFFILEVIIFLLGIFMILRRIKEGDWREKLICTSAADVLVDLRRGVPHAGRVHSSRAVATIRIPS